MVNLERHLTNITQHFGLPCIVSINHFTADTEAEIALLQSKVEALGGTAVVAKHWAHGGAGAEALASAVAEVVDGAPATHRYVYPEDATLWEKMNAIATKIYGAAGITANSKVRAEIEKLNETYGRFPVCMAKTQMSFSTDPTVIGAPSGHTVEISEVRLSAGARFIVAVAGNMMTMPGLPKVPAAEHIDVDKNGNIVGLF
jgi:formate--tetrahydrofolate ligase